MKQQFAARSERSKRHRQACSAIEFRIDWAPFFLRKKEHEMTPSNEPLERAGADRRAEGNRRWAGRSAPRRSTDLGRLLTEPL